MRRKANRLARWAARVQIGRERSGGTELHDLDSFTAASIQKWQAHAQAQTDYQYALFFDLEAQRAARHTELCAALHSQPPITVSVDGWCGLVNFKYCLTGLSPVGSLRQSGRCNFGEDIDPDRFASFPALYLAEDFETAFREYHGLASSHRTDGLSPGELSLEHDGNTAPSPLRRRPSPTSAV